MFTLTSIAVLSSMMISGIFSGNYIFNDSGLATGQNDSIKKENLLIVEKENEYSVIEKGEITVTAYSSTMDQTDDSPFIMASGRRVYDGAIAANFLPFGAKVRFPELYGEKIFTVEDRMNKRHSYKMDVWMETRRQALNFGVKKIKYEVVRESENQTLTLAK